MRLVTEPIRWYAAAISLLAALTFVGLVVPASAQTTYEARLSGHHKVPPIATEASGSLTATLDGDTLTVTGSFDDLSSTYTNSHLHVGLAGEAGGVSQGLTPTLDDDSLGGTYEAAQNTFTLSATQKTQLQERKLYVNVHSSDYPAGEIRGQLLQEADAHYYGVLSGGSQVGGINTMGKGAVAAELHGDSLFVTGAFDDLTSDYTASHLHLAIAGTNGGVEQGLSVTTDSDTKGGTYELSDNRYELTADQKTALQARELYANVHTDENPGGELRAQLAPISDAYFEAIITGTAKVPAVETDGSGQALVELRGDSIWVSGSFTGLTSAFTNSHLHVGMAGQSGGVAVPLSGTTGSSDTEGTWAASSNGAELTADQRSMLFGRELYLNVHTAQNPAGEVRGQVLPISQLYLQTSLSGTNEVDPDTSHATGGVVAEVSGDRLVVTGGFNDLSGDLRGAAGDAHLHAAGPGANGGVEFHLEPESSDMRSGTFAASANTVTTSSDSLQSLVDGNYYVNVHSEMYAAGEIRGQLLMSPNHAPDSAAIASPADSASVDVSGSASQEITPVWNGADDADDDTVVYVLQISTDSDFSNASLVMNDNVGTDTTASITYGTLDSLLSDQGVSAGGSATWHHRVIASDGSDRTAGASRAIVLTNGTVTASPQTAELPSRFELEGNYPNPFNPSTTVRFDLPRAAQVDVEIYDALGRRVMTVSPGRMSPGRGREVRVDASHLPSGLYLYRVRARMGETERIRAGKMTLLK